MDSLLELLSPENEDSSSSLFGFPKPDLKTACINGEPIQLFNDSLAEGAAELQLNMQQIFPLICMSDGVIIASAICIFLAAFSILFFGYKVMRATLFILGALFGFFLGFYLLDRVLPETPLIGSLIRDFLDSLESSIHLTATELSYCFGALIGLLIGAVAASLWQDFGVFCVGSALGALFVFLLYPIVYPLFAEQVEAVNGKEWVDVLVFVGMGVIFGLIALCLKKLTTIAVSSLLGSYGLCFSVDLFIGNSMSPQKFISGETFQRASEPKTLALLISFGVLLGLGIFSQLWLSRGEKKKPKKSEKRKEKREQLENLQKSVVSQMDLLLKFDERLQNLSESTDMKQTLLADEEARGATELRQEDSKFKIKRK